MGNVASSRPRHKVRTLRWHPTPACLCINVDGVVTGYTVSPAHATLGAAFYLDKEDGQGKPYLVEVAGDRGHCSCPSFKRWKRCKHHSAIQKLVQLGKLPHSTMVQEPA